MIIYDENYKFLGISNETVSFLGYEDVTEFISANSDFADLLVEKEGKIYKFQNFSWIDFILYSGAPNKAATVRLKDGTEVDIKLTVKEIVFAHELGGIKKCYGVRIINDDFVKIASKVNGNMKFEVNKNVKLSNLLTEPSTLTQTNMEETTQNAQESIQSDAPLFDLPPAEDLNKNEAPITSHAEEEFHLPFDELETPKEEEKIVLDFTHDTSTSSNLSKAQEEVKETQESQIDLSFLKKDLALDTEPIPPIASEHAKEPPVQTETIEESPLSFLKSEVLEEEPEAHMKSVEEPSLSFLKSSDSEKEAPDTTFNSDFIKLSEKQQEPQKEVILQQIKDDIDEIDREYTLESGNFIRQFLKTEDKESL